MKEISSGTYKGVYEQKQEIKRKFDLFIAASYGKQFKKVSKDEFIRAGIELIDSIQVEMQHMLKDEKEVEDRYYDYFRIK